MRRIAANAANVLASAAEGEKFRMIESSLEPAIVSRVAAGREAGDTRAGAPAGESLGASAIEV